jgi:hypothetical protein
MNFILDRFKVEQSVRSNPDSKLPTAHTCFFRLVSPIYRNFCILGLTFFLQDLPAYSTFDICYERLKYAIQNTHAIDTDFNAAGDNAWNDL